MKKSLTIILLYLLILNVFIIPLSLAQNGLPDMPGFDGEIDKSTGLPVELQEFKEIGEQLSKEEQRKDYLKQEWTKILAENKFFGPVLFYTNKIFSFFNPIWKIIFGVEFSWSWAFLFSILIWLLLIILLYAPSKAFTNFNPILTLIFSIILASLVGTAGIIQKAIDLLAFMIKNTWIAWLALVITILIAIVYYKLINKYGDKLKKQSKKERLDRAEKHIIHKGEILEKEFKD